MVPKKSLLNNPAFSYIPEIPCQREVRKHEKPGIPGIFVLLLIAAETVLSDNRPRPDHGGDIAALHITEAE